MMLKPKEVCQKLGISYRTLQSYVKKGYIQPVILQSGKWRFREEDVEKLMGIVRKRKVVLYARVSSNTQKDEVSKVVVAYPDRLVRFGFEIIEEVCKAHNCELVVLNKEDKTPEQN